LGTPLPRREQFGDLPRSREWHVVFFEDADYRQPEFMVFGPHPVSRNLVGQKAADTH
jgi:hypothetical protein